jgi:glycosyltransferase involved in cell wall biosynthesis
MIKNIILVYPSFERGGVKKNFLSYLKILSKKKINVNIITDKKINKKKFKKNIKVFTTKKYKFSFIYKYLCSFISAYKILQLRKSIKINDLRVISFQSSFFTSIICRLIGYKLIVRVSEDPIGATKYSDNIILAILIFLTKIITYNLSYKIFVNSRKMNENLKKLVINKKKIILQYNMNLKSIRKYKINNKKNIFLNIGRFCKQKNQILILKAFKLFIKKNKNFLLYLCGDGPDTRRLKVICKDYNIEKKVKFLGWKNSTKEILIKSKYFIFPSLYEGLPNALIDAVNFDLVCICNNVSGVNDICGKNYVPLKKNNAESIFQGMQKSVSNYNYYSKKNLTHKKKLNKFLFKNLENKLLKNIK